MELAGPATARADEHRHGNPHGELGPSGGHLIELGRDHKYHAELVENEATETVTVIIRDSDLNELAIDAKAVFLNLVTAGRTTPYEISASAASGEKHARFQTRDHALFHALEQHCDATAELHATIAGIQCVGRIAHHGHHHDHGAHDHGAHDHGAHDHGAHDHGAHDHGAHDHGAHDH